MNKLNAAHHALDEARDAFARAAAALTVGNRLHDRSAVASALLEGSYALMKLAEGDYDDRAHDEAVEYLKHLRKEPA